MKNLAAIVLAAGKGTRMKSRMPKVLHPVAGRPMLSYVMRLLEGLGARRVIVVVGHGAEEVQRAFASRRVTFVEQTEQRGTGHAVMCAAKALKGFNGDVLILSGDVPLLTASTVKGLFRVYRKDRNTALGLITTILDDPGGYGRVLRDERGAVAAVVEDKDATPEQRSISEVNAGTYLVDSSFLLKNIRRLKKENVQGEYYLPDLVGMAVRRGRGVTALTHLDPAEVMGVNNRVELARASRVMRLRVLEGLMLSGVTVIDPDTTYITYGVKVGPDTTIHPSAHISGDTAIGTDCVIEQGAVIRDSAIGARSVIKSYSVIEESAIGRDVAIGPFARLRPRNRIADGARIGNFVEVKKTTMGRSSKANHLTYLGDSVIGSGVNIGAGTITCNYDGARKHTTRIDDGAFIGSDSQLIAPVRVGRKAYVGSGTTVTKDVPPGALVLSRAEEKVVKGWVKKRFKK